MAEGLRHGVVLCRSKGSGTWCLLTPGIFSVPGRRVVPQHGAVRCPDDHGCDAVHGLHLQPLCYQRGSVSAFLLLVPEAGALCPGTALRPSIRALARVPRREAGSCSPLRRVSCPSPALCPVSTLVESTAEGEARAVSVGALLGGGHWS